MHAFARFDPVTVGRADEIERTGCASVDASEDGLEKDVED